VVQQGGSKTLSSLALENCTDKGGKQAAQALARIGITQVNHPNNKLLIWKAPD